MRAIEVYVYESSIRNKLFNIAQELQDVQLTFELLAKEKIVLSDKYGLIYTQLRLVRKELSILVGMLSKIDGDFKVEE